MSPFCQRFYISMNACAAMSVLIFQRTNEEIPDGIDSITKTIPPQ